MTEEKISTDAFANCLKQLVINCESIIREADSIQSIQESLQRLEENDENFYKYELVKLLKLQLNDKLGSYIDETIEQYPANRVDLNHAEMIDNMTSKLIYSSEYLKLSKKFKTIITNANEHLVSRYDTEIGNKLKPVTDTNFNPTNSSTENWYNINNQLSNNLSQSSTKFRLSQQQAQAIFNDNYSFPMQSSDCESSTSSFFNHESCLFLNQQEMVELAEELDGKKKSLARRQEALVKLLKMPVVDIHCWDILGPGLIDSLNDPDLYNLAVKFIAKGFISTPSNIKALYCTLVKQLEILFTTKKNLLPIIRTGIDIRRQDIQRILISLRLINEFQQNAIHFWVRYSEKFLEDIMESTLKLFSINYKSLHLDSKPTPLHFLSLIDPKAEWMIKWTHGTYSRNPLLRFLGKYKTILEEAISCCLRYFSVYDSPEGKANQVKSLSKTEYPESNGLSYSSAQIDYLYFIHSISVVVRTVMYKSYRTLLEEVLVINSNTISSFMCNFMVFWFKTPECSTNNCADLDPHTFCYNIIKSIAQDKKACKNCFCNMEFLSEIFRFLSPLKLLTGDELEKYLFKYQNTLCRLCDILSDMIQYKNIRVLFFSNPQKILMPQSAVELFCELIHKNLTENQFLSSNLLSKLIAIVCQFYNGCVELNSIWALNIHSDLVQAWKEADEYKDRCSTPTKDKSTRKLFQIISWEKSLSDNLLWLAKTRRGVLFLEKHDLIPACLHELLAKAKPNQIQVERLPIGNIDLVINQIASTQTGIQTLVTHGILQRLITEIWSITECDPDDLPIYQGCVWPIQSINIACLKPLVKLIAMHSAYSSFYNMIFGQSLSSQDHYSFREIPKNLIMFIDRLVIINKSSKIHGLFNYESSHLCGLCWLSATVANLNCLLLLESQFQFIDCLIEAQNENRTGNKDSIIIDAISVERNHIINKSLFLAGPSERILSTKRAVDVTEKDIIALKFPNEYSSTDGFRCSPILDNSSMESDLLTMVHNYSQINGYSRQYRDDLKSFYLQDIKSKTVEHYAFSDFMALLEIFSVEKMKQFTGNEMNQCVVLSKTGKFSKFEELGIRMIVEYGRNLKLLPSENSESDIQELKLVLTNTKSWMNTIYKCDATNQGSLGFDWFTGCIFLLCHGNGKRCIEFLSQFICFEDSTLVWPLKSYLNISYNLLLSHICHWIEIIMATQCPAVYSSFQICGYSLTEVCSMWLTQCFLNIFNWPDIVTFITSNILFGPSFSIYFCVSLFKHLEPHIKQRLHNNDLTVYIREVVISDFNLCDKIEEIMSYKATYDDLIEKDLKSIYNCM